MSIKCYSQRLLNPFRGVINVIRYQAAEAVTTDGIQWDIYVSNDELLIDLDNPKHVQTSDIRYGKWNANDGLKRGPLHPSEDFKRMEALGDVVYEHLLKTNSQIPFDFADRFELWLVDQQRQPLALLDSAVSESDCSRESPQQWRAGFACRNKFQSTLLKQLKQINPTCETAAQYLETYINSLAAKTSLSVQWFRRHSDGSGTPIFMGGNDKNLQTAPLQPQAFPVLLLNTKNHDLLHTQLIEEFTQWQAPWLLLLDTLNTTTRAKLERQARQRALAVAKNHLLYPQVVDTKEIKAACVEALLRQSQAEQNPEEEEVMSTFYLELQSTTME